jgi:hypothetical protein
MSDALFRVRFYKNLVDSSGHTHRCLQGQVELSEQDETTAVAAAQVIFALHKRVEDWSFRADFTIVQRMSMERTPMNFDCKTFEQAPDTSSHSLCAAGTRGRTCHSARSNRAES